MSGQPPPKSLRIYAFRIRLSPANISRATPPLATRRDSQTDIQTPHNEEPALVRLTARSKNLSELAMPCIILFDNAESSRRAAVAQLLTCCSYHVEEEALASLRCGHVNKTNKQGSENAKNIALSRDLTSTSFPAHSSCSSTFS